MFSAVTREMLKIILFIALLSDCFSKSTHFVEYLTDIDKSITSPKSIDQHEDGVDKLIANVNAIDNIESKIIKHFPNGKKGQVDPVNDEDSKLAPHNTCGIDTNGNRIYGGQVTELDEFPWMTLLGYRNDTKPIKYRCGGSLINKRYILTAAHCIIGRIVREVGKLVTARLGEYDIRTDVDCIGKEDCADPMQEIAIQLAVAHPGYNQYQFNGIDDIGLLRLAKRVQYSYFIQPICLVNPNKLLEVGTNLTVAGWGVTLEGKYSDVKQKVSVPLFDRNQCKELFLTINTNISESQVCAGGEFRKDPCTGDSGGPLMNSRSEGVWEAVAVMSFGYGCGRDGLPAIYTSIPSYFDWILKTMRSTNIRRKKNFS